ncbi:protein GOLVEN 7 [Lycium ferocissimum]|uniref:protein GOLVEN 7 n=1 Tax=Lycium ferocissimum TaxID=112874 RepID=UPI002815D341|nr:protein GOLVEN 7 [Lycium ferocissimum]
MTMLVPIVRVTTTLLFLILIAQNLSNTSSYQGSNIATKSGNFVPNREASTDVKGQQITSRRMLSPNGKSKNMDGYVAFTADYKLPRHHPPKNN